MTSVDTPNAPKAACETPIQPIRKQKRFFFAVKRLGDIVMSALGLIVLLIPMGIVALCVKLETPGPAIFRQERLGRGGKPFTMYKFRSMHMDAEKDGPVRASSHDDRCTKVGDFLRKSYIDELPQLWNILKGDMSFVGPRPERAYFYNMLDKDIPEYRQRLQVKPGLTGLAQVESGSHAEFRLRLGDDMKYIESMSVGVDMKYIWKTVLLFLGGKKRDAK